MLRLKNKFSFKPGFQMIAMIAAIAKKKFSDRNAHLETTVQRNDRFIYLFVAAIVAIIWKPGLL